MGARGKGRGEKTWGLMVHDLLDYVRIAVVDSITDTLTISVKHVASLDSRLCGVCAAAFIPAEDSGSRVLSMAGGHQEGFAGLLCGGCYSKWSHGTTVALRRG